MKHRSLTKDSRTGKYYARIQVDGVRKKFYFCSNRRAAEAELRQLEADLENGTRSFAAMANKNVDKTDPKNITVENLIRLYLEWVEPNRARATYINKKTYLQPFLDRYGDCLVSDINHSTLSKYYAWAKKHRGYSANRGNRHLREVKTLLLWGENEDVCICPVRRFPIMREFPSETRKFTDDELPILLKNADPDFRDMIVFGLMTGLRPQEIRKIQRKHIRLISGRQCIVLENHKTRMTARISQPRVVPLSLQATDIMKRQTEKHTSSTYIFLNGHGKPYTANIYRQRLERACERAGIEKRPPYALRHYFGTKRAGEGLNLAILAQVMGHGTVITTMRYVAKVPTYQQQAMDAMATDLAGLLDLPEPPPPSPEPELKELPEVIEFPRRKAVGE